MSAELELNWPGIALLGAFFCLYYRAANLPKEFDLVVTTKLAVGDIGREYSK